MKKVLIFGANERTFQRVDGYLDCDNIEVVGYIDNNSQIWEEKIKGKSIMPPRQGLRENTYDAILIGSVYWAPLMKKELIKINDYYQDKCFVFWDEDTILELFYDPTGYIKDEDIEWIYREPEKMKSLFHKVCDELDEEYKPENYIVLSESQDAWWKGNGKFIAHAGGGYVNGRKQMYTNSKEAFYESYENGFRYIETDIVVTSDGNIVAYHDENLDYGHELITYDQFVEHSRSLGFTPMDIYDIINYMYVNQDANVILDIKSRTVEQYEQILQGIIDAVNCNSNAYDILQRFIIQVHEEKTLMIAKRLCPLNNITLTLYRMKQEKQMDPSSIAKMCAENDVKIVTMGLEKMNYEYLCYFIARNIAICIHPVDRLEDRMKGEYLGVNSFITNYLLPWAKI